MTRSRSEPTTRSKSSLPLALLAAGLPILAACESATEPADDHADEVEGVILVSGGQTLASYDGHDGEWTGELEVEPGEETGHIDVRFVDHDGDPVELGDDYYLKAEVQDESVAGFEQDAPGEFEGHLHGRAEGDTEIVFSLMHGAVGSGHADFATEPLHVHVHEHEHE